MEDLLSAANIPYLLCMVIAPPRTYMPNLHGRVLPHSDFPLEVQTYLMPLITHMQVSGWVRRLGEHNQPGIGSAVIWTSSCWCGISEKVPQTSTTLSPHKAASSKNHWNAISSDQTKQCYQSYEFLCALDFVYHWLQYIPDRQLSSINILGNQFYISVCI